MPLPFTGTHRPDRFNLPVYGLRGAFTLSEGVTLPYFLCSLPVLRVIDELKIAEQVPPSLGNEWNLDELFQREVDRKRVDKEMVKGYLADPKKIKFFNAITVVLMPKDRSGSGLLDGFAPYEGYPSIPYAAHMAEDAEWSRADAVRINFGGVQYVTIGDNARLRWDADCIHPIVVDGQHRLVALREYHDVTCQKAFSERAKATTVPVIFLMLASEAGFDSGGARKTIRQLSRELFTDLNKNAKKVDKARELILDDYSISARCTRTLVTREAARDSQGELPLALVRWQDAVNRFDSSYYLNSITHVESLVSTVLPMSEPKDPLDASLVTAFIEDLSGRLSFDGEVLKVDGASLLEVYYRDYCDSQKNPQIPFSRLPTAFLDAAIDAFERNHKPWLISLLTQPRPYASLLAYARDNNLIEGDFGRFWAQSSEHKKAIKAQQVEQNADWYAKSIQQHIDNIEAMKGDAERDTDNADWSFKAIFQKALVRLALDVVWAYRALPHMGTLEHLISCFNHWHSTGLLRVGANLAGDRFALWSFIGTNPQGGKIKVAKNTEDRLLAVMRLWYYADRLRATRPEVRDESARWLLNYFDSSAKSPTWPGCKDMVDLLVRAHDVKNFMSSESDDADDKIKNEAIKKRLSAILDKGLRPA
jgi:hypothetical protein